MADTQILPIRPNPGRWGNWTDLHQSTRGDTGLDWPFSADGHCTRDRIPAEAAARVESIIGRRLGNKEWVCIQDGRAFIYHSDGSDWLFVIEQ